ncbi:hypothetical protein BKA69DRAFT_1121907 [Paraphysoderma sedebokerense]|nr:hypothetical protein BKA69DRAFT_1121907 [Paraphysoderma sedebokerense]
MSLEGKTEYNDRFPTHQLLPPGERLKKQPVQLHIVPHEHMSSVTESRQQYSKKDIPKKFQLPKREYVPNPSPLDAIPVYASDYPDWKAPPPTRVSKVEAWKGAAEKIEGITTSKSDYTSWPTPARPQRKKVLYQPNPAKFETVSNYHTDFQPCKIQPHPPRPAERYQPGAEDRDFKSQMRAAFVGYTGERPKRKIVEYHAPDTTFEGSTLYSAEFKVWPSSKATPAKPQQEHQMSTAPLDSTTEYSTMYLPKSVPRIAREPVVYNAPNTKFEGESSIRTDYRAFDLPKRVDFRPKAVWKNEPDNRDFVSESSAKHDYKELPACKVVEKKRAGEVILEKNNDGHIYLKPKTGLAC